MKKSLPILLILLFIISCSNEEKKELKSRPNIIVIMADDLGYSDLGSYGGEIDTPNLDFLAEGGIRFTQFYNASRCSPSRASLLTGKYPHQVGLDKNGQSLSKNQATIAEVLKDNGYRTGMTGKWHLSETKELKDTIDQLLWLSHRKDIGIFAPLNSYPSNRGFEEFWGVIWGVVNFFDPFSLVHNEDAIKEVSEDFYITDFISDKAIDLVDEFSKSEDPFFLYVAHTAPHWPLHALPEDIAKYKGIYDTGWDKLRENRYKGLIEKGIINPEIAPLAKNESGKLWAKNKEKAWESKHMEVHAAMIDRMDQGIGRLVQKLKETNEYDNTLILFLADNGASSEKGYPPGFDRPGHNRKGEQIIYPNQKYEQPGEELTWGYLGDAWAGAVNAPFRYWKRQSFEGGICSPLIIHWPKGLKGKENTINNGVGHVIDILPTFLEVTGASYPSMIKGLKTTPVEGRSMIPLINGEVVATNDTLFWEHETGKALRLGNWKITALIGGEWELFDLAKDRTETNNLAYKLPEKVNEMETLWKQEYQRILNQ